MRAVLVGAVVLCLGCVERQRLAFDRAAAQSDSARAAAAVPVPDSLAHREPGVLRTVKAEPAVFPPFTDTHPFEVTLRTEEQLGGHTRHFGTISRQIALRLETPDLTQYPCTSCHFGTTVAMKDQRIPDAHQNIRPVHPRATGAVCSTCHAADNVERLNVKSGERPTLNHSYRLCAQCHFSQGEAWAGGGHGKRLDGWQGRRVVMGCTDCHNPHHPATESRIPFRAPTLGRVGREEPHR